MLLTLTATTSQSNSFRCSQSSTLRQPVLAMEAQNSLEALGFEEIVYVPPGRLADSGSCGQSAAQGVSGSKTTQQAIGADIGNNPEHRDQQYQWQQYHDPYEEYGDRDQRSVYVSNVNPASTKQQLHDFFSSCGTIRCITLPISPQTQRPMGHAYIEFSRQDEAQAALKLSKQEFLGRQLYVNPKKTNIRGYDVFQGHVGFSRRGRRGMGRGGLGNTFGRQGAAFPDWSKRS